MRILHRRIGCMMIIFALLCSLIPTSSAAKASGLGNFTRIRTYDMGHFTDVPESTWYAGNVKTAYELNLSSGTGANTFSPHVNMTVCEAVALAARLHCIYYTGSADALVQGIPWYQVYVDYALANGIMTEGQFADYSADATRAECAVLLSRAIPAEELETINTVDAGAIPDVSEDSPYYDDIYLLYRAGILTGNDAKGTFTPDAPIDRVSMITIATRLVDKSLRKSVTLKAKKQKLSAQDISAKCADAVFYIETYSFNGDLRGSGSGFFISSDGLAVTNFHVVANTSWLEITTTSGEKYADIKIIDTDVENDIALLRVSGQSFPYLETGVSDNLVQGQTIYAIGSPIGLQNTMSQGLVSNPNRQLSADGTNYIQISAQTTNGSSGGALIDEYGEVVGITSAGFIKGYADLNLAVPISYLEPLDKASAADYWCWDDVFYPGLEYALDFGVFSGVELLDTLYTPNGAFYVYDIFDFHAVGNDEASTYFAHTLLYYEQALEAYGFIKTAENDTSILYENDTETVLIMLSFDDGELVVCAEEKTQYYAKFPSLPDAGWYFGDIPDVYGASQVENSIMYAYDMAAYYTVDEYRNILSWYFDLLEDEGFEQVYSSDVSCLFEGNGLSIVYLLSDGFLVVDVALLQAPDGTTSSSGSGTTGGSTGTSGGSAGGPVSGLIARNFPWHLYSNDGKVYLGKLTTNQYDANGVWNTYGSYGSKYSQTSIWNEYGTYGSQYSSESAFNEYASKPPQIVDNYGNFVGYLTENQFKLYGYTIVEIRQFLLDNFQ